MPGPLGWDGWKSIESRDRIFGGALEEVVGMLVRMEKDGLGDFWWLYGEDTLGITAVFLGSW